MHGCDGHGGAAHSRRTCSSSRREGRRSGRERSTVLLYFELDDRRFIVASFAGSDQPPAWYLNLVADPRVSTEVAGVLTHCFAHVLDDDEAAEIWPYLDEAYHGFDRYRQRTSRRLPIVELIPEQAAAAGSGEPGSSP